MEEGRDVGTRKREFPSSIPSGRRPLHKVIVVHIPLKLDEGKFKALIPAQEWVQPCSLPLAMVTDCTQNSHLHELKFCIKTNVDLTWLYAPCLLNLQFNSPPPHPPSLPKKNSPFFFLELQSIQGFIAETFSAS